MAGRLLVQDQKMFVGKVKNTPSLSSAFVVMVPFRCPSPQLNAQLPQWSCSVDRKNCRCSGQLSDVDYVNGNQTVNGKSVCTGSKINTHNVNLPKDLSAKDLSLADKSIVTYMPRWPVACWYNTTFECLVYTQSLGLAGP